MSSHDQNARPALPVIKKASLILGQNYRLRDATISDAEFILELRSHEFKKKYISETSHELDEQVRWLENYSSKTREAYFVIETRLGAPLGTVRIYNPKGDSFCFGSWVTKPAAPVACAVESVLIVYHYALDCLGFARSYFSVRKPNRSVWGFMERFGGSRVGETEQDYLYETDLESVKRGFLRYARYLKSPIQIIP